MYEHKHKYLIDKMVKFIFLLTALLIFNANAFVYANDAVNKNQGDQTSVKSDKNITVSVAKSVTTKNKKSKNQKKGSQKKGSQKKGNKPNNTLTAKHSKSGQANTKSVKKKKSKIKNISRSNKQSNSARKQKSRDKAKNKVAEYNKSHEPHQDGVYFGKYQLATGAMIKINHTSNSQRTAIGQYANIILPIAVINRAISYHLLGEYSWEYWSRDNEYNSANLVTAKGFTCNPAHVMQNAYGAHYTQGMGRFKAGFGIGFNDIIGNKVAINFNLLFDGLKIARGCNIKNPVAVHKKIFPGFGISLNGAAKVFQWKALTIKAAIEYGAYVVGISDRFWANYAESLSQPGHDTVDTSIESASSKHIAFTEGEFNNIIFSQEIFIGIKVIVS